MFKLLSQAIFAAPLLFAPTIVGSSTQNFKRSSLQFPIAYDPSYVHIPGQNAKAAGVTGQFYDLDTVRSWGKGNNATQVEAWFPSHLNITEPLVKRLNQPDPRFQYTNAGSYPWSATGRFLRPDGGYCSGALVGPRHMLTALHCIPTDGRAHESTFCPMYDGKPGPAGCAHLTNYIGLAYNGNNDDCTIKYNWVVVILDVRLGDNLGYFGYAVADQHSYNNPQFTTIGYPRDLSDKGQRPFREDKNYLPNPSDYPQFSCDSTGPFATNTNSAPGQSGSVIWRDNNVIWGTLLGGQQYDSGKFETVWSSGQEMFNAVSQCRHDYP